MSKGSLGAVPGTRADSRPIQPFLESLEPRLLLTTVSLALSTTEIQESGGTPAVFTVSRDNAVGDLTVNYRVGGSESVGKIAQNLTGTLVIPAGSTSATISATPIDDGLAGYNNTLTIQLLDPDGDSYSLGTVSQGTVRINESDSLLGTYVTVGPGKMYAGISIAVDMVSSTMSGTPNVFIDVWPSAASGGVYQNDYADIRKNGLTIRGIGAGRIKDYSDTNALVGNDKGIFLYESGYTGLTVENFDFQGARGASTNCAGFRGEGSNWTVRNCYFANNQNGILSSGTNSNILIEYSEFYDNGVGGDGHTHNLYISGGAAKLTFQYNYSHEAYIGHLLKSRAKANFILYNRFQGGLTESYEVSTCEAGKTVIVGNVIRQAPGTQNPGIIDYASEVAPKAGDYLYVVGNTIVNDLSGGTFIQAPLISAGFPVTIKNNILAGPGTPWSLHGATPTTAGNVINTSIAALHFVNVAGFDYHLLSDSPAIGAGVDPGVTSDGLSLAPTMEYVRENGVKPRAASSPLDAGAYDYAPADPIAPTVTGVAVSQTLLGEANVGSDTFTVTVTFSEAMKASLAPTIAFTPAVAGSLVLDTGSWTDTTHYTAWYNATDADVEVMNIGIGVTGAQDVAGNTLTAYNAGNQFGIDTVAPIASAGVDHVQVTLAATDSGSGVKRIKYQVNSGSWLTYAAPFSVLAGDSVSYFAQDVANNSGTTNVVTVPLAGGDANKDGYVDVVDLGVLAKNYGLLSGAIWDTGDFSGDGKVDVVDLGVLAKNYGYGTPGGPTGESAAGASSGTVSTLSAPVQPAALLAPVATITITPLSAATMDVVSALDSVPAIGTVKGKRGAAVHRRPGQAVRANWYTTTAGSLV